MGWHIVTKHSPSLLPLPLSPSPSPSRPLGWVWCPLAPGFGSGFGWLAWVGWRWGWLGVWLAGFVAPWLSCLWYFFSACRADPAGSRAVPLLRRTA